MNTITNWIIRHDRAGARNPAALLAIAVTTAIATAPIAAIASLLG